MIFRSYFYPLTSLSRAWDFAKDSISAVFTAVLGQNMGGKTLFTKSLAWALVLGLFVQTDTIYAQSRLAFMHGADDNNGAGVGVSMWVNNGDGTFRQCKISDTGFDHDEVTSEVFGDDGSSATFYADVTGDGVVDIVHVSEYASANAVFVYKGNGRGSFNKTAIRTTGMQTGSDGYGFTGQSGAESSFVADVDGDGKLDYAFSGADNKIHVYLGNGNGTFSTTRITTTLTGANSYGTSGIGGGEYAFLMDVNGDGKADLVATNEGSGRSIRTWLATTTGSFNAVPVTTINCQATGTSQFTGIGGGETSGMADVNGDGKLDFVHANEFDSNNDIFVFLGDGLGGFAPTYVRSVINNPPGTNFQVIGEWAGEYAQWVDVTGDGKIDFVASCDQVGANSGIYTWVGNGDGTFQAVPKVTLLPCTGIQTGGDATETTRIVQAFSAGTTFADNCRIKPTGTTTAPGGVSDLLIWLKADDLLQNTEGSSLLSWSDSLSWGSIRQNYPAYRPIFNKTTASKLINFNPSVSFDGTRDMVTDHRLYCSTSPFQVVTLGLDERTNTGTLRGMMGMGSNGNYPALDLQTDATSLNGWNPYMVGGTPLEYAGGGATLFNGNSGGTNIQPQIFSLGSNNAVGGSNNILSYVDGYKDVTTLDAFQQSEIGNGMYLGSSDAEKFLGRIPEAMVFTKQLNDGDMRKVNSYLAIKYGITLSQSTPQNYLASDSTILWNATTNAAYKTDITVIGRDDVSGLNQKQSKSVNAGIQPIISLAAIAATNQANTGAFTATKSFDAVGHNGLATNFSTPYAPASYAPSAPFYMMARVWKVQETGTVGTVTIGIPLSTGAERLLVSTTSAFAPATTQEILMANDGNGYMTATVDLADGQFFSFGRIAVAPGCVFVPAAPVNGIAYTLYNGYTATPETAMPSTVLNTGFIDRVTHPDDFFVNEIVDGFSLKLNTNLSVTTAGNYNFRFVATDDVAVLFVNGVQVLKSVLNTATTTTPVALTAGMNAIEVRFSENTGAETINLEYSGADNGNAFAAVPASKLFTTPSLTAWHKADAGVTNTEGSPVSVWEDQSVNNNDLKLATGDNPLYYSTTAAQLVNSNPSIVFTDDQLKSADQVNGLPLAGQGKTIFSVASKPTFNVGNGYITSFGRDNINGASFSTNSTGADFRSIGWNIDLTASAFFKRDNQPSILTITNQSSWITATNNGFMYGDGLQVANGTQALGTQLNDNEDLSIGFNVDKISDGHEGKILESIVYPWVLSTTDRQKVESYLAIKYGTTLSHNYLSGAGTVVYDVTTYGKDVVGIGREDCQGLYQKQSKSVNASAFITVSKGAIAATNGANTGIFTDKTFEIIGDNGLAAAPTTAYTPTFATGGLFYYTMARIWKVQEAGTVDSVTITIKGNSKNMYLVVNNAAIFGAGTTEYLMKKDGKGNLTATVDFTNGQYFTFAMPKTAPGGVIAGNTAWFRADAGVEQTGTSSSVDTWADQSNNAAFVNNQPTQATVAAKPTLDTTNLLNFNPTISFDGGDWLKSPTNFLASKLRTTTTGSIYSVTKAMTGGAVVWGHGTAEPNKFNIELAGARVGATSLAYSTPIGVTPRITGAIRNVGTKTNYVNGELSGTSTGATNAVDPNEEFEIGAVLATANVVGDESENIMYSTPLSAIERNRVESYLAIKYGITLDQTTPQNYVATDGTTKIWDPSVNGVYKNDITGIGRDDVEALDQSQSKSVNASAYVTMGLGIGTSNVANTNSFAADKSYEVFGDNGLATTYATAYTPSSFTPTVPFYLMSRVWKVQETGTVGIITISIPDKGQEKLLVSSTSAFAPATTQEIALTSDGNGNLTAQVDFQNGDFFTFGRSVVAPGGVVAANTAWFKANAGVSLTGTSVDTWADQSDNAAFENNQPKQATAAAKPTLNQKNLFNFNPAISFDGGDILKAPTAFLASKLRTTTTGSIFSVTKSITGGAVIFGHGTVDPNKFNIEAASARVGAAGQPFATSASTAPRISSAVRAGATHSNYTNGAASGGATALTNATDPNDVLEIGAVNGGNFIVGDEAENIMYSSALSATDKNRVESYLAIKYGITLDQTTPQNYLAADGTTKIWDPSVNGAYKNDIAGIGRDDAEGLNQKQSLSANLGVRPTIGLNTIAATNAANVNAFAADKSYEIWASNGLGAGYSTNYTPTSFTPLAIFKRFDRAWKVQETGTVGPVTVKINSNADYMLVDTDGDGNFATGTIAEVALSNKQATYDFQNGDVFTFGRDVVIQVCNNGLAFVHGDDATFNAAGGGVVTEGLSAWKSNGDGTFSNTRISQTGFNRNNTGTEVFGNDIYSSTYTADVDGDGDVDIIHATEDNSNSIYVYLNNGNSTFQTTPMVTTNMQAATASTFAGQSASEQGWMGDANDDGKVDYIFSGTDNQIHVYLGLGDGKFTQTRITSALVGDATYGTSGLSAGEYYLVADVNNDGSVDLVGTYDPGRIKVWLGNGDGTFQANPYFDALIQDAGSSNTSGCAKDEYSQFADIDGDSDLDYVHAEGLDGSPQIWAFLNNGDGSFATTAVITQASVNPGSGLTDFANYTASAQSFFTDVNGDGKADYIATIDANTNPAQNGIGVYLATSNGSFAVTPIFTRISNGFATGSNNSTETSFIACGVIICNAGNNAPALSAATKTNICPAITANLTTITANNGPNGVVLTWHTATPATLSNRVLDSTAVVAGTYYAAFLDKVNGCLSPTSTAVVVTITSPCPAAFTFNCGTAAVVGTFAANAVAGQMGSVTIPMTGATAGFATFTVTGAGFTGTLTTTLTAGQASVSVPITFDGSGAAGTVPLSITSTQGTGTCSVNATVSALIATFAFTFNCSSATSTGTFTANGTVGQTGTLTVPLSSTTAGDATFTVTGTGFTGTLTTTLTANQASVIIPIVYDGTGTSGSRVLTVTSSQGTGACTPSVSVVAGITCAVPTVGGTAAYDGGTLCDASNIGTASLSGQTGNVVRWETSTNSGSSWLPLAYNTNSYNFVNAANGQQYRAVLNNGGSCLDANSAPATIATNATNCTSTTCDNTTGNITFTVGTPTLAGFDSRIIMTNASGVIQYASAVNGTTINSVAIGDYLAYRVVYDPAQLPLPTLTAGTNITAIGGACVKYTNQVAYKVCVATAPDLTTTIGQPTPALVAGQPSNLPITVANIGTAPAPGIITTTITLPAGVTAPTNFTSNGWTCSTSAPSVTCTNPGPINAGASSLFNVPITPDATTVGTKPIFNATTNPVTGETITGNNAATPLTPTLNVQPINCSWTPGAIGK
jgi:FG-GAP-like repeat